MTEIVEHNNIQYIIIGAGINILTSPKITDYKTCSLINYKDNLNYENVLINFIESYFNEYEMMTKENYDQTIFIEEALHRIVEVYYKIGLVAEAKEAASILGYNYGSGEWYEKSYKVFNKEYKSVKINKKKK